MSRPRLTPFLICCILGLQAFARASEEPLDIDKVVLEATTTVPIFDSFSFANTLGGPGLQSGRQVFISSNSSEYNLDNFNCFFIETMEAPFAKEKFYESTPNQLHRQIKAGTKLVATKGQIKFVVTGYSKGRHIPESDRIEIQLQIVDSNKNFSQINSDYDLTLSCRTPLVYRASFDKTLNVWNTDIFRVGHALNDELGRALKVRLSVVP